MTFRREWFAVGVGLCVAAGTGTARAQRPPTQVRRLPDSVRVLQPMSPARVLPQRRVMPPLVDSTEDVARSILSGMRISPVIVDRPVSDPRRDGRVFDQRPAAGQSLTLRDTVMLVIDRYVRPAPVVVPDVAKRPLTEAIRILRDSSLTPAPPRISRADILRAIVDSQSPRAGVRVSAGTRVVLSVTIIVVVPDVVGRDVATATGTLAAEGLAIRVSGREYSDAMPAGRVLRQHPDSGARTHSGAPVDVWLSVGPHPQQVVFRMPLVVGLPLGDARDTLAAHQLRITHVDSLVDAARAGRVIDQAPPPGAPVHAADAVDLVMAVAPRPRRVPWVVGMRRAEASQVLADSGFAVRVVVVPDSLRSDEEVIAQRPDSGIPRRPVTLVAIDVVDSVGPPPPRPRLMPRVLSMTRDEAAAALAFLSPRLTITERPTTKEEENGRVVDQYPLPDVPVFPDLEVLLAMGRYEPQSPDAGPAQVTQAIVPPLIGRSIAEARDLLAQANLRMGDLSSRYEAAPESVVVGQTPDSGAAVPPGTVVAVDLQPAAPGTGRIPPRNGGDNGIDWYWWLLIAGGVPVVYVVWRLIRDHSPDGRQSASPGVHAEVKQGRFEPPRVVRKDDDRLVAFEVTFVNRVPESTIELPGSLILREENP